MKKFIDQIQYGYRVDKNLLIYSAGVVAESNGIYLIHLAQSGAENTFSIGQPVFNRTGELLGYLGIGLYEHLDYSAPIRIPCEFWQICLPTSACVKGVGVYTYWQIHSEKECD